MGDSYPRVRLAAVQAAPVFLDREATIEKARRLIREAGDNGADFVAFPECFVPGHPLWYYYHAATSKKSLDLAVELFKNSIEIPSPATDVLCEAAAEAKVFVVMGLNERRPSTTGTLYNTLLFIDRRGQIVGKRQKLVPTIGERLVHGCGADETQGVVMSEWGPVSGLACGQNSNPMSMALLAAQYTRIHVAAWPNHFIPGFHSMCDMTPIASRNVAYMCKCYVLSTCGTNSPEMLELLPASESDRAFLLDPSKTGGSIIIDPRGNVIAGPLDGSQEGILYADADLELTIRAHFVHDFGGHYNRTDVFQLRVFHPQPSLVANAASPSPLADHRETRVLEPGAASALPAVQQDALVPAGPRVMSDE